MSNGLSFAHIDQLAAHLRHVLSHGVAQKNKDPKAIHTILLFAYNGTGKTRLSMAFKDAYQPTDSVPADTLYFNAFTEDLFSWDNDFTHDRKRTLVINQQSKFFAGLEQLEMENRIRPLLQRYGDFDFIIDYDTWTVSFTQTVTTADASHQVDNVKVSRGEENMFIWCFFLAIAQLAMDTKDPAEPYSWVRYLYIDDPISSLDDNNAIAVASHLAQLLQGQNKIKTVISSHHTLFFNVMWNELNATKKLQPYFLSSNNEANTYHLRYTNSTPFFHHIALLQQLHEAVETDKLYTYHFNVLRSILEKTATFHGFKNFSACIKKDKDDTDGIVHARMINVMSHGNYSLFEPTEMLPENKAYFKKILTGFMDDYRFAPEVVALTHEQNT